MIVLVNLTPKIHRFANPIACSLHDFRSIGVVKDYIHDVSGDRVIENVGTLRVVALKKSDDESFRIVTVGFVNE